MLFQHGKESGEERDAKAGVKDCLADNDVVVGTIPDLKRGRLTAESGTVHLVDKNAEGGRLLVEV